MSKRKVIITCAVTGSLHVPSQSPYLPITPQQIAAEAEGAVAEGASIIHLHARDPADGRPTADPRIFMEFLPRVKATGAIVNITTGGGPGMTLEERMAVAVTASPEMASLNMGSFNNGMTAGIKRIKAWKHAWELPFLQGGYDSVFKNTYSDIEKLMTTLGRGHGVRFECEIWDMAHLYNLAHMLEEGHYEPPLFLQFILGALGGVGAELDHLLHMKRTADRLFGEDYLWSVLAVGRHQMGMCTHNALMGGHVRVGLEDSLGIGPGQLACSNAEQVAKIRRILEELAFEVATPAEARAMLKTKGANNVRF